jgi:hypothetical protein
MTDQPLALLLADELENPSYGWIITPKQCAAELRRLHAENEDDEALLRQALEALEACLGWPHVIEAIKERLK